MSVPERPRTPAWAKTQNGKLALAQRLFTWGNVMFLICLLGNGKAFLEEDVEVQSIRSDLARNHPDVVPQALAGAGRAKLREILAKYPGLRDEDREPAPQRSPQPDWPTVGSEAQLGDARIEVVEVKLIPNPFTTDPSRGDAEHLQVRIRVRNTSATQPLEYLGWLPRDKVETRWALVRLRDEFENDYRAIPRNPLPYEIGPTSTAPREQEDRSHAKEQHSGPLLPGASVDELLVFDVPIPQAQELRLLLSGDGIQCPNAVVALRFSPPDRAPRFAPGQRPAARSKSE